MGTGRREFLQKQTKGTKKEDMDRGGPLRVGSETLPQPAGEDAYAAVFGSWTMVQMTVAAMRSIKARAQKIGA
jgi:hypothetical protein